MRLIIGRPMLLVLSIAPVITVIASLLFVPHYESSRYPIQLEPSTLFTSQNLRDNYEPYGYVAHALGGIDGQTYTNSREAFLLNYDKGFRIFEVDLVLLKDGSVFCAHDGNEWKYGLDKSFKKTTADELAGRLCLNKYTPLTGSALLDLMYQHEDAYFILNTKGAHYEILRTLVSEGRERHPSVLDRMIPLITGPGHLYEAAKIYPFKDYMLNTFVCRCTPDLSWFWHMSESEIIEFVKDSHIRVVMTRWNRQYTPEFKQQMNDAGAVVYVHSLNDADGISRFQDQGVGVFSDGYYPGT